MLYCRGELLKTATSRNQEVSVIYTASSLLYAPTPDCKSLSSVPDFDARHFVWQFQNDMTWWP